MPVSRPSRVVLETESWPPTQMRLHPSSEHDDADIDSLDLSRIDDDPLNYFLTPAPISDDETDMFDFDAGIEDAKRRPSVVRSVSPSSLEGLRLPAPRPPTPPRMTSSPDPDNLSSDDEEYIKFVSTPTLPVALKEFMSKKPRVKEKSMSEWGDAGTGALLSPASFHVPVTSGSRNHRTVETGGGDVGYFQSKPLRLSPHSWREPSPDVWSIEEEGTEDFSRGHRNNEQVAWKEAGYDVARSQPIDIPAAKPKKRVRFVLPLLED